MVDFYHFSEEHFKSSTPNILVQPVNCFSHYTKMSVSRWFVAMIKTSVLLQESSIVHWLNKKWYM